MTNYPDLYGWDTAFAVSISQVNIALAKLPATSTYTQSSAVQGGNATVSFALQNWQLTDTPGGNQLVASLDFTSTSTLTLPSNSTVSLSGWSLSVTFAAAFESTGQLKAITASNAPWATVVVTAPNGVPFAQQTYVQVIMTDWFNQSTAAMKVFDTEFVTVDIGAQIGSGPLAWLQPARLGFAGALMQDGFTKALGILAMTDPTKDPAAATLQLSPYAVPVGAQAGYLVSRDLVLENMILPGCASAFSDDHVGKPANFELYLVGQENQLRNANALSFHHDLDGASQPATIAAHGLNVSLDGDTLTLDLKPLNVQTKYAGVSLNANIAEDMTMSLVPKTGDPSQMVFILTNANPSTPDVTAQLSEGAQIASAVLSILIFALTAALTVLTFKGPLAQRLSTRAAKIWARVIAVAAGVVGLVIANVEGWIALAQQGETHDLPDFAPLITAGLGGITFPGGTQVRFNATAGQFANGMLITIAPQF